PRRRGGRVGPAPGGSLAAGRGGLALASGGGPTRGRADPPERLGAFWGRVPAGLGAHPGPSGGPVPPASSLGPAGADGGSPAGVGRGRRRRRGGAGLARRRLPAGGPHARERRPRLGGALRGRSGW